MRWCKLEASRALRQDLGMQGAHTVAVMDPALADGSSLLPAVPAILPQRFLPDSKWEDAPRSHLHVH